MDSTHQEHSHDDDNDAVGSHGAGVGGVGALVSEPKGELVELIDDIPLDLKPMAAATDAATDADADADADAVADAPASASTAEVLTQDIVKFLTQKATKDPKYFAMLSPEPSLGTDPATDVTLFSYQELVRRNMLKSATALGSLSEAEKDALDLQNLASHLSEADFQTVFGKSKEEFDKLAGWKQTHDKKAAFLF
jgi:hypothetical protein